uniref:Uncharacterized protein n=1 Tax=Trichuris muris TaxID=70415 RepID=A0A5S6QB60_TRIMR
MVINWKWDAVCRRQFLFSGADAHLLRDESSVGGLGVGPFSTREQRRFTPLVRRRNRSGGPFYRSESQRIFPPKLPSLPARFMRPNWQPTLRSGQLLRKEVSTTFTDSP